MRIDKTGPNLSDSSGGSYSSGDGPNKGFTHGFLMTFEDAAARDNRLPHPDHQVVKEMIMAELDGGTDGVIAFDRQE